MMRRGLTGLALCLVVVSSAPARAFDDAAEAEAASAAGQYTEQTGELVPDALFDLYEVQVEQGQHLIVNARSQDFDTFLSVKKPDGTYAANDDWGQASGHSHVHLIAEQAGAYQVRVAGFDIDAAGPYRIDWFVGDASPDGSMPPIHHRGELEDGDEEVVGAPGKYVDTYEFAAEPGQHVIVDLTSWDLDTVVMMQLVGGRASWENDDHNDDPGHSRLSVTLDEGGTYSVQVTSYEAKEVGAYDLTIRRGAAPPEPLDIAREPYTGELSAGDAQLDAGEFYDAYPITGVAGEQVTINLRSTSFDTYLLLVQEGEGGLSIENDDATDGDTNHSQIVQILPADGVYTVYATSYEAGETGGYRLDIQRVAPRENKLVHGTLAEGDLTREGGMLVDWIELPTEAGEHIEVVLESAEFDTYLLLESPEGAAWVNDDDFGRSDRSRVVVDADKPGVYRVGVSSFDAGEAGAYTVDIRITPAEDPAEARASRALVSGDHINGELIYSDTRTDLGTIADRYHFNAESGQRVVIDMTSAVFDTYLRVLLPDGSMLENDDLDSESHSQLSFTAEQPGRYRVIATSYAEEETGAYELSLAVTHNADLPPAPGHRVYGVFVGITDYGGSGDLPFSAEDAERMYRHFRDFGGMRPEDAKLILNQKATVDQVAQAVAELSAKASANDTFVFFYSGHGNQVPRDGFTASDPDGKDETLSVIDGELTDDRFAELLDGCHAGTQLILIDSCFAGGFAKDVISKPGRIGLFSSEEDVLSLVADKFEAGGFLAMFVHEAFGEKRDAADLNHDKALTAHELCHYVAQRYGELLRQPKPAREYVEGTEVDPGVNLGFQKLVADRGGVSPHHVLMAWD